MGGRNPNSGVVLLIPALKRCKSGEQSYKENENCKDEKGLAGCNESDHGKKKECERLINCLLVFMFLKKEKFIDMMGHCPHESHRQESESKKYSSGRKVHRRMGWERWRCMIMVTPNFLFCQIFSTLFSALLSGITYSFTLTQ